MKYVVTLLLMMAFANISNAQLTEPFGTKCDPSINTEFYQVLADWHNQNKYDVEEVSDLSATQLREALIEERFVAAFEDGGEYEIYRFSFKMGEEAVGVTLTVDTKECSTDTIFVSQYR